MQFLLNPNVAYINNYLNKGNKKYEVTTKHKLITVRSISKKRKMSDENINTMNRDLINKIINNYHKYQTPPCFFVAGGLHWNMSYQDMFMQIQKNLNYLFDRNYFMEGHHFDSNFKKISNNIFLDTISNKKYKISDDSDFTKVLGSIFVKENSPDLNIINSLDYKIVIPDDGIVRAHVVMDYFSSYDHENILDKNNSPLFPVIKKLEDCIILEEYIESGMPLGYMTEFDFEENKITQLLDKFPDITEKIGYYDFNDDNLLKVGDTIYIINTKLDCFFQSSRIINFNEIFHRFRKDMEYKDFDYKFKNIMDNLLNKIKITNTLKSDLKQSWKYYYKSSQLKSYNYQEVLSAAINFVVTNQKYCKINEFNRSIYSKSRNNYLNWKKNDFPNTYINFDYNLS